METVGREVCHSFRQHFQARISIVLVFDIPFLLLGVAGVRWLGLMLVMVYFQSRSNFSLVSLVLRWIFARGAVCV